MIPSVLSWSWANRSFLYIGRLDESKGLRYILEAWDGLVEDYGDRCPALWIVGGAPFEIHRAREAIGQHLPIVDHEISGRLQWWGYLDAAGVSTLLLKSLALVTHSGYEPGGRVILEAMTEGVPVVATPHGFAMDLVTDWNTGFLVEFGDVERLRARLSHFVRQPLLSNSLGTNARRIALEALDSWRFVETHCETYQQALAVPTQPANNSPRPRNNLTFRRIWPTYPYVQSEPSEEVLRRFVETALEAPIEFLERRPLTSGKSLLWHLSCRSQRWIIKWLHPVLNIRPLWDASADGDLLTDGEERYRAEAFASSLPGVAATTARCDENKLILRPLLQRAWEGDLSAPSVVTAIEPLQRLFATSVFDDYQLRQALDHDWRLVQWKDLLSIKEEVKSVLRRSSQAWNVHRRPSLGLALRSLACQLHDGRLYGPAKVLDEARTAFDQLTEIAAGERHLRIGICHGDPALEHFRRSQTGMRCLIDAEKLHPGFPGEDLGDLLIQLAAEIDDIERSVAIAYEVINLITENRMEHALIAGWAVLLAFESIVREATLQRLKCPAARRDWKFSLSLLDRLMRHL